ncbi:unnamed protein product [Brassicogethes aeneus]|uniref:Ig-like domain-containing protein n=1 Tax=Brassicogethes aeneus TaxID=1431903 RepID=A0A9P0BE90_BRAAE|nr:unnamed protein product [Brassicogethes aeneus]
MKNPIKRTDEYRGRKNTHQATMPLVNLHFIVLLGFCTQMALGDCPRLCDCKWKNGKESVICLNANLFVIPLHLDSGIQVLDLTGNNLSVIKHEEFSKAGLINLQKIYIAKCRLKTIERYAFKDLINLVELDLSYNALTQVPSHTFDSIPELRDLKLNGNPIQKIQNNAFINIPQLNRLELTDCRISQVEPKGFCGVERSLEYLKLDKNRLNTVTPLAITILNNLHGIELASNPWNCSCQLRPLREWMLRQNVPFGIPPSCLTPKRLYQKTWDKLELDEYACVPEIVALKDKTQGVEGKNITMQCRIAGVPEPNVRWLLRNKVIANLSGSHAVGNKKLYVVHLETNLSDLTIFSAELTDAGTYTCAAENKAGKAEASVTLAMSKKPVEKSSGNFMLASVVTGVVFAILSSVVAGMVVLFRKKHQLLWRTRDNCRDDNYEKIEMKVTPGANGDVPLLVANKKNGEYRVVPCGETDQEQEEDDEPVIVDRKAKLWNPVEEKRWASPEHLLDPEDLHIPRRTLQESRDKKIVVSTSGTYNPYLPSTSTSNAPNLNLLPLDTKNPRKLPTISNNLPTVYATTNNGELSCLNEDKSYPDVIGNSSTVGKANSEGGSVTDITQLFCTLPRKKALVNSARYKSTDSQSPLLAESRYNSSGGESSCGSQENNYRKLPDIPRMSNLNYNRVNKISNSYLNLTREDNSTPLLDVSGLEKRIMFKRDHTSNNKLTPNANSYDHHAAQLEKFLEEYRQLHKELTKMKQTCDNLRVEKTAEKNLPAGSNDNGKGEGVSALSPNSNQLEGSVDFRNFENELTKYLMSKSTSKHSFASGLFNNT